MAHIRAFDDLPPYSYFSSRVARPVVFTSTVDLSLGTKAADFSTTGTSVPPTRFSDTDIVHSGPGNVATRANFAVDGFGYENIESPIPDLADAFKSVALRA